MLCAFNQSIRQPNAIAVAFLETAALQGTIAKGWITGGICFDFLEDGPGYSLGLSLLPKSVLT